MFRNIVSGLAGAIIVILLLLVLYANYDTHFSDEVRLANMSAISIREVKIGMDTLQVNKIMGRPETVSTIQQDRIYHYAHKPGSSSSYRIKFDTSYKVIGINIID
ncbi:outer membrane protein assembly factor BamE [uncultured Hymenobacter sp.]|uniref:outer membrane protein assembly factor BamE domain-containing protein n=1 Tax=uncultured Hymenobacter sp. TaxID=170016 RepID=UPI0035CC6AE0